MDFGALQSKPSAPLCTSCPLGETCFALHHHLVDTLPRKAKRIAVRDRYLTYIYVRTRDGQTLLRRRGSGDIWQGLFEFPLIETAKPLHVDEAEKAVRADFRLSVPALHLVAKDVRHQLTHQRLHTDFYSLTLPSAVDSLPGRWVPESDLGNFALPRLLEKLLALLPPAEG